MKTRNIFTKGLLLASAFAVSGCSSFLDEKDWSSQSAEEYYAIAEGYESLINGAYSCLLYTSNSIMKGCEYLSKSNLGYDVPFHVWKDLTGKYSNWQSLGQAGICLLYTSFSLITMILHAFI